MIPETMPEWLRQRAALTPDRPALLAGQAHLSFADLDRRVGEVAGGLAALGVQPGDRVGLLLPNGMDLVYLIHAIPRLGATLLPLNLRLTAAELEPQLTDAGVRLLVYGDATEALVRSLPPTGRQIMRASDIPRDAYLPGREVDLAGIHSIIYTSGTTGKPKGAMLSYGNFWWSATGSALNLGHHLDDRWLACMPLFHVGGLSILLRSVIYGIPAVIQTGFDPAAVNQAIDHENISLLSVVATMLSRMLDERQGRRYPPSLRCVLLGGGPAPRPLLEACAALQVPVIQTYGLTETASQVVTLSPEDALRKLGSAGKPLFPMQVRIDGGETIAPAGEAGEILVRGPSVMVGYLNRPIETAEALRGGWLHTGDLGYLDDQGYLYILDRREDLIVSGGENVYPAEVEAALLAHPAVLDAGVYGVEDPEWGQQVTAAVVLRDMVSLDVLLTFVRARLAGYKVPRRIRVVDALPRNSGGKVLRRVLRETHDVVPGTTPLTSFAGFGADRQTG